MTLTQQLETAMAAKRAELINLPLARCWGELAKVAKEICIDNAAAIARSKIDPEWIWKFWS